MVPNQVRYQLRHIPIGTQRYKKILLIAEKPLSLHSLRRLQALAETVREGLCNSRSKR